MFCDRGIFDGKAYVEPEDWVEILKGCNYDVEKSDEIMDLRYDAVIHMVTAADGAPKFYDLANEARSENHE